ncbi:hypothetical protein FQZ97_1056770 [compost metagenome]
MSVAVPLARKVKLCVSTKGKGAVSRALNMPGAVGVGYSLMPRKAPMRVWVPVRYSMASLPKKGRVVARTSLSGERGSGMRCHSPLTSRPWNSTREEKSPSFSCSR